MQLSCSRDLEHWTPYAQSDGEENYCVLVDEVEDEYVLVHSPANGIGIKRSTDLVNWYDECLYILGQRQWPWAQGRITAGHLLDLRRHSPVGKYLLTFHGATHRGRRERAHHGEASIAIAWSNDLLRWHWPGGPEQGDAGRRGCALRVNSDREKSIIARASLGRPAPVRLLTVSGPIGSPRTASCRPSTAAASPVLRSVLACVV